MDKIKRSCPYYSGFLEESEVIFTIVKNYLEKIATIGL